MAEYIDVDLFDETLSICDNESWHGMLNNVMQYLLEQNGLELNEDSDEWFNFKYDMLEPMLISSIEKAILSVEGMRCCDPEYWKDDLTYICNQAKED